MSYTLFQQKKDIKMKVNNNYVITTIINLSLFDDRIRCTEQPKAWQAQS